MENFFLRSKAYVLFVLLIAPMILSFYFQFLYFNWVQDWQTQMINTPGAPPPLDFDLLEGYKKYVLLYLLVLSISSFTQLGYWHTIATKLSAYLPAGTNLKARRFRFAFLTAAAYLVGVMVFIYFAFDWFIDFGSTMVGEVEAGSDPSFLTEEGAFFNFFLVFGLVFVCGIIGFVSMVYCAYYAGKTLRCIEMQRPQEGSAILGYAVLAYFLIIGVWIFQPKIQRLLSTGSMSDESVGGWE